MSHKVDVLLTIYTRTEFLENAIRSVLAQTFDDFQLHILDDGGLLATESIIAKFRDYRIRHYVNNPRAGVASSVFSAIRRLKAPYFAIINDDDQWSQSFLFTVVRAIEAQPNAAVAFCRYNIINAKGAVLETASTSAEHRFGRDIVPPGIHDNLEFLVIKYNLVQIAMGAVVRRSCLRMDLLYSEVGGAYDFWIAVNLGLSASRCIFINEILTQYRDHDQMETNTRRTNKGADTYFIYRKLIELGVHQEYLPLIRKREREAYYVVWRNRLRYKSRLFMAKEFYRDRGILGFIMEPRVWALLAMPENLVAVTSEMRRLSNRLFDYIRFSGPRV